MARINWTEQAISDLENIAEYISRDSIQYAKITVLRIRNSVKQLKQYPTSGRIVPEINIDQVREIIVGNYRIIYFVESNQRIDILTVHHSAKRLLI